MTEITQEYVDSITDEELKEIGCRFEVEQEYFHPDGGEFYEIVQEVTFPDGAVFDVGDYGDDMMNQVRWYYAPRKRIKELEQLLGQYPTYLTIIREHAWDAQGEWASVSMDYAPTWTYGYKRILEEIEDHDRLRT